MSPIIPPISFLSVYASVCLWLIKIAEARALVAYLAVEKTGHSAAEVARFLGISRMGVQKAVIRGSELKGDQVSLG